MRRVALAIAALTLLAPAVADAKPTKPKKATFSVGAAKRSTDPLPEHGRLCLGGYGSCPDGGGRTMTGIKDPMFARALAISNKDDGLILVHTTNIGFFASYKTIAGVGVYHLRQEVARRTGLPAEQVIVQADHSHSGPDTVGIWGGVPPAWIEYMQKQAVDAAVEAWQARRPARLYSGATDGPGVTSSYSEEPNVRTDDRFHLLWANDRDTGERIATFTNYSPHATVLGSGNKGASGDWPEWASTMAEQRFGGAGIAGVGTLGREDFGEPKSEAIARDRLTRMMGEATAAGSEIKPGPVKVRSVFIREPLAQPVLLANLMPEGAIDAGGYDLSMDREPSPPWLTGSTLGTFAGAARIGDLFVGISPGEPFPQIQFYLRDERGITGAREHLHLGAANDFLGYMAPVDAYPQVAKEGLAFLGGCPEEQLFEATGVAYDGACPDHWTLMVSPTIGTHVACTIQDAGEELGFTVGQRAQECAAATAADGQGAPSEYAPPASTGKRQLRRSSSHRSSS